MFRCKIGTSTYWKSEIDTACMKGITVLPKKREGKNKLLAQCNIQHQITNFGFSPFFGFSFSYSNIGENERHPSIS